MFSQEISIAYRLLRAIMLVSVFSYGAAHFTEGIKYILDKENYKWVDL